MFGNKENELDRVIEGIRNEEPDPAVVEEASARVWARLSDAKPQLVEHIRSCADFQALIPEYQAGKLSEARALLVQDHTHECVACRKAFDAASGKVVAFPGRRPARKPMAPVWRWAVAAIVIVGLGLTSWAIISFGPQFASRTTVQAVNGSLYRVAGQSLVPVTAGQILPGDEEIRTARDSGAVVQLSDGSRIEIRERSGLRVTEGLRDITVHLGSGSIIVQAAKRRSGHLYVATRDCRVAVTGTVFSVNSGLKGSRVSVVEGEVHIEQSGRNAVLRAGDQFTSSDVVEPVPVEKDIAWSRNVDQHLAMLKAMKALDRRLSESNFPALRHSSSLMPLLPVNTAVYAAIPNLADALAQAEQVFGSRAQENAALQQWWQDGQPKVADAIARLKALSGYVGDEIVIAATADDTGKVLAPVVLANVVKSGLAEYLKAEISKLPAEQQAHVTVVPSLGAVPDAPNGAVILVEDKFVVMSPDANALRQVGGALEKGTATGFAGTPFGAQIAGIYSGGAGLLFSADLERFGAKRAAEQPAPFLPKMKYLTIEQAGAKGKPETRAVLGFQGARNGFAAWLAEPAPLGALQFISPAATVVGAFAVKQPAQILDEIVAFRSSKEPGAPQNLAELEDKLGVSVRNDLVAPLDGEFAFALDGPALPIPSWKLVAKVNDAARLQGAIERLVRAANTAMTAAGRPGVAIAPEQIGRLGGFVIKTSGATVVPEIHFVVAGGYLVATPNLALLQAALELPGNRQNIASAQEFKSLLPRDGYLNPSAVFYQNLGSTLAPMADLFGSAKGLTPEQQQGIKSFAAEMKPMLVAAYAEQDRITLASTGSLLSLGTDRLGGLGSFLKAAGNRGAQRTGTRMHRPAYPKER